MDHLRGLENPSYAGHLVVLPKSRIRHLLYIFTFAFFLYDAVTVPYVAAFWSESDPTVLAINVRVAMLEPRASSTCDAPRAQTFPSFERAAC